MKKFVLLIFLLSVIFCEEEDYPTEDNVIVLKESTFDKFISTHEYVLVKFYAPWCGHCKELAPEYSTAARILERDNYYLAQVDATEETNLKDRFKVKSYPKLVFFVRGEPQDYKGGRKANEIIHYVKKYAKEPIIELKTMEEVYKHKSSNDVAMIYFGDNEKSLNEYKESSLSQEDTDTLEFAFCKLKEAQEKLNVPDDSIVIFKNFDEGKSELKTNLTRENINLFINFHTNPTVMFFSKAANNLLFQKSVPLLLLFRKENEESTEKYDGLMHKLAPKFDEKVKFVICNYTDDYCNRFGNYFDIKDFDVPCIRLFAKPDELLKYKMLKEINEENIEEFIQKYFNNKLRAYYKSEPIPTEQKGDVKKIVGLNFQEEVIENDKDVLIIFYAPWCGHCRRLAPTYNALARKLKNNTKIVIGEIDGTGNEIEGVVVKAFPTIKFWPGNKKNEKPIDFKEDRTLSKFIQFLRDNAYHPFVVEETKNATAINDTMANKTVKQEL